MSFALTYVYLIAFVSMVVLATVFAIATPPQPTRSLRVAVVGFVGLWALADFLSNLAATAGEVERLARVFAPVWAMLPFLLLVTVLAYTRWPRWSCTPWVRAVLAVPAVGCVVLVEAGWLYHEFLPASANGAYFQSLATSWQWAVTTYHVSYALLSVVVLLAAAHRLGEAHFRVAGKVLLRSVLPVTVLATAVNGGLSPFGIHLPFLGSVLCCVLAATVGIGILRRGYFAPVVTFRRERDAARDALSRWDELLSSLPLGVAVLEPETQQVLYANKLFRSCMGRSTSGEIPAALRAMLLAQTESDSSFMPEFELSRHDDRTRQALVVSARPAHFRERPVTVVAIRDATEQRVMGAELTRHREQLARAQRMEAVGQMSAGLAHDFNNQLSIILTNASVMSQTLDARHRVDLDEILRAVERGRQLTSQLLAFSRKQAVTPEVVDVNEVLRGLQRMLQRLLGINVLLVIRSSSEPARIRMDRARFEQVILALATNAGDAMPSGGTLTLEVTRLVPESAAESCDGSVVLCVRDDGQGIASDDIEHVFEPFFSTKGERGTGLGLATAYSYLQDAGASIAVASSPGKGAAFTLRFHSAQADTTDTRPVEVSPVAREAGGGLTILLVDDEEAVRRGLSRVLRQGGHRVVEASGGQEAISLFRRDPADVGVLITDVVMPGMDGRELARVLQEDRPDLPVLFMSGHLREQEKLHQRAESFLRKPFSPDELLSKLDGIRATRAVDTSEVPTTAERVT